MSSRSAAGSAGVGLREQMARGALLGFAAGALDVLGGKGRRSTASPITGALIGAAYAAGERLLKLPPLGSHLEAHRRRSRREDRAIRQTGSRSVLETPPAADRVRTAASRRLYQGAAALSFSVVADSSLEHYRGGFYNPVMFVGPIVSGLTLIASLLAARRPGSGGATRRPIFAAAAATGLIGTGFHAYNVARREGGRGWLGLFYAAPLAAPMGATFAGLFGLAAERVRGNAEPGASPRLLGRPAGRVLGAASALGLMGTAAEAGLLHFRGAFQDPFMYVPVTVPPLAACTLAGAALAPTAGRRRVARVLLRATAAAGFAGVGFHAYGVHRNMGGWKNWSQNLLQGPPLPAPPSFTGMALAGLAALDLTEGGARA